MRICNQLPVRSTSNLLLQSGNGLQKIPGSTAASRRCGPLLSVFTREAFFLPGQQLIPVVAVGPRESKQRAAGGNDCGIQPEFLGASVTADAKFLGEIELDST